MVAPTVIALLLAVATVSHAFPNQTGTRYDRDFTRFAQSCVDGGNLPADSSTPTGFTDLASCLEGCASTASCAFVGFSSSRSQCVLYKQPAVALVTACEPVDDVNLFLRNDGCAWTLANPGSKCTTPPALITVPVAGEFVALASSNGNTEDRVCRDANGNSGTFDSHTVPTLEECQNRCIAIGTACQGIEYKSSDGECEVHRSVIASTDGRGGYMCYLYKTENALDACEEAVTNNEQCGLNYHFSNATATLECACAPSKLADPAATGLCTPTDDPGSAGIGTFTCPRAPTLAPTSPPSSATATLAPTLRGSTTSPDDDNDDNGDKEEGSKTFFIVGITAGVAVTSGVFVSYLFLASRSKDKANFNYTLESKPSFVSMNHDDGSVVTGSTLSGSSSFSGSKASAPLSIGAPTPVFYPKREKRQNWRSALGSIRSVKSKAMSVSSNQPTIRESDILSVQHASFVEPRDNAPPLPKRDMTGKRLKKEAHHKHGKKHNKHKKKGGGGLDGANGSFSSKSSSKSAHSSVSMSSDIFDHV